MNLQPFSRRGLTIIGVLLLVNIVNFIDRGLPGILVSSIRTELHLSDVQIGLLIGVAFAVMYSFAALVLAQASDRLGPRLVLVVSLSIWSLMTALSGFAQNFTHLVLARAGVSAGESGSTPAAHALIARVFVPERHALVIAIFSLGVPIGGMIGVAAGGVINDLLNWRAAFFVVGLPGLAIAILAQFVLPKVPPVPKAAGTGRSRFFSDVRYVFTLPTYRHIAAASALFATGAYGMGAFIPSLFIRTYHLSSSKVGVTLGLTLGVGGFIGTYAGGALVDWLGREKAYWRQLVPAIGQSFAMPVALTAVLSPDYYVSIAALTLFQVTTVVYYAPTFAVVQSLVPDRMRATAAAVLLFCLTIFGSSLGPLVVGWISDWLKPQYGDLSLRYALCCLSVPMVWSAVHFAFSSRCITADLKRTREADAVCALK